MDKKLLNLRTTIFTNKVLVYHSSYIESITGLFSGKKFVVIFNNKNSVIGLTDSTWSLQSVDKQVNVVFDVNRIDIITEAKDNNSLESVFDNNIDEKFSKIVNLFNANIIRMAFAPTYIIETDDSDALQKSFFVKTDFYNTKLLDFSFNNTFRKNEILNQRNVPINYCANISLIQSARVIGGNLNNKYVLFKSDINTSSDNRDIFDIETLKSFFNNSSKYNNDFISLFFE